MSDRDSGNALAVASDESLVMDKGVSHLVNIGRVSVISLLGMVAICSVILLVCVYAPVPIWYAVPIDTTLFLVWLFAALGLPGDNGVFEYLLGVGREKAGDRTWVNK